MMGRSHALTGLTGGCCMAAMLPAAPITARALVVVTYGGASLLPDLDQPQATAARSLGFVTKGLAHLMDWVSLQAYYATTAVGDSPERQSGHRLLTHTVPASVVAGLLVGVSWWVSPVAMALLVALLAGLLAHGFKYGGVPLFFGAGLVSWFTFTSDPWWWWTIPTAVTLGCVTHIAGDWVTNSGVPVLWPLVSQQKRWRLVNSGITFDAGGSVETNLVRPWVLWPSLTVALGWALGLLLAYPLVVLGAAAVTGLLAFLGLTEPRTRKGAKRR